MPPIYIAACIVSVCAVAIIGFVIFRLPRRFRSLLIVITLLELPMCALAFYLVRVPLMEWLRVMLLSHQDIYGNLRPLYAPLTEEPAKLWVLLIPWIATKIKKENVAFVALAIGFGFGIGEAWVVANSIIKDPSLSSYPWYYFNGYISERLLVCFGHSAMTCTALYYIFIKKSALKGISLAMLLHFIGNFPIFLSVKNLGGLGKPAWDIILYAWVQLYFIALIALWVYFAFKTFGKTELKRLLVGQTKCPECGLTYVRPLFLSLNLLVGCYEKCPSCKKWHFIKGMVSSSGLE